MRRILCCALAAMLTLTTHAATVASLGERPVAFRALRAVFPEVAVAVETASDCRQLDILLAANREQRARGLMFVEAMPAQSGMLFIYPQERSISMWMKNTLIPLDMVFADSTGSVVSLLEHVPALTLESRPSRSPARYVLELNAGIAAQLGIRVGSKLYIATL